MRELGLDGAVSRVRDLAEGPARLLLGIAGPPGAGKSTLAATLAGVLGPRCALVPMDGFHLADAELARLHRIERKGAPDTFDAAGYAALLARLRARGPATVYAPAFDRALEQPVGGSIAVPPAVSLVITEGNYLLLDGDWAGVRPLLDEVWWVDSDADLRRERLVERHVRYGKRTEQARAFVEQVDEADARIVDATRDRADAVVTVL